MNDNQPPLAFLEYDGGPRLAYRLRPAEEAGRDRPVLMFLPGYASDMDGAKAVALDGFAAARGLAMLRFDYSGTGSSDGDFTAGTLERWLDEALAVADQLTTGTLIVVGSSMGGWIGLHLALRRPERVAALVGIAAAPDFTDWGFSPEQRAAAQEADDGPLATQAFWQSADRMRLLDRPIALQCPVRLIHGDADTEVPPDIAMRLLDALRSADVQLTIVKGGGHRLSEPREIDCIVRTVAALLEPAS